MQVDEDFNIKFVKLVEEHKCLYDKKVPEYRNKDFQEKSWIQIAEETRESVPHCKERWRNLRACLSRYIKQQNSSDPQHKPYYLTEHMQFVLPFLKSSRQTGTIINNSNSNRNNNKNNSKNNKNKNNNNNVDYDSKSEINIQIRNVTHPEETNIGYQDGNNGDDDDGDGTRSVGCYEGNTQNFTHFSAAATRKIPTTIQTKHEIIPSSMNCTIPEVNIDIEQSTTNCEGLPPPPPEPEVMFMTSASTDSLQSAERKRFKIEHHYADENSDMDFFKSILPDISNMSPLQKRKFKIGILELIDNVFDRYPSTDKKSQSIMHPPGTLSSSTAAAASMCMTEIPNCYWKKL